MRSSCPGGKGGIHAILTISWLYLPIPDRQGERILLHYETQFEEKEDSSPDFE
jgi:hypothetical protein